MVTLDAVDVDLRLWTKTINRIARQLHNGKLKAGQLDQEFIQQIYNDINKGASEGYGANYTNFNVENSKTVQQLQQNIYTFSAAKSDKQLKLFNSFLVDDTGKERSFNSFKTLVLAEHEKYNINYLQAEFQTAKSAAQMARKWENFQRNKERFPNLKYKTAGDSHVRDEHTKLNNFVAHIDDPIWDRIYPPNGWRCRCHVVQTDENTEKIIPDTSFLSNQFSVNVGKTNIIFTKDHPFFFYPKRDDKNAFKKAFELFKINASYGKAKYTSSNGAKVFVNPFADSVDLQLNFKHAITIADKVNINVRIRPHVNINGEKNPEYEILNEKSDLKNIKGYSGITNGFSAAREQKINSVVFNLNSIKSLDVQQIYRKLKGSVTESRNRRIKHLILVYKNNAVIIKRKAILDDNFRQLIERLKG